MATKDEDLQVEEDKHKGGNTKLVIIVAAAAFLLGGAGVGGFLMLSGGDGNAEGEVAVTEQKITRSVYYRLEKPFILNFDAKGRQRYLQIEVYMKGKDQSALDTIAKHEPVIKNHLNNLFSDQDLAALQTDEGRIKLNEDATALVQDFLQKEIGSPGIEQVLFTNFVMQ